MARHEQDREDLLAEAKNLVERASFHASLGDGADLKEVVVGFRRDGSLAIYFAADRVYQFTSTGQLRRAYLGERLYKSVGARLVSLDRFRTEHAVELVSQPLTSTAQSHFLAELKVYLDRLNMRLSGGDYKLIGQIPAEGNVVGRVLAWLDRYAATIAVADSPHSR
jgi:hypothetical protein